MDYEKIKLMVLDVDGTLTEDGIYYDSNGKEIKRFNVKDGLGVLVARNAGLKFAIITGRVSPMVQRRAEELEIEYLIQGVQKKYSALLNLAEKCALSLDEIGYIGDDLNDLQCMEAVGFCACPEDAVPQVKKICHHISPMRGGNGAVREILEYLLSQRGQWDTVSDVCYRI
ncbi:MAG: HAD-IIIA family hydrolase [Clostridia bacterium]|nr:HAD-IIIA family hydrolase [Clostridia bacterium]